MKEKSYAVAFYDEEIPKFIYKLFEDKNSAKEWMDGKAEDYAPYTYDDYFPILIFEFDKSRDEIRRELAEADVVDGYLIDSCVRKGEAESWYYRKCYFYTNQGRIPFETEEEAEAEAGDNVVYEGYEDNNGEIWDISEYDKMVEANKPSLQLKDF